VSAAFTPGPWWIGLAHHGRSINGAKIMSGEAVDRPTHVATISTAADKPLEQKEADANLIAAAPDLFYAVHDLLGCLVPRPPTAAAVATTFTPDYAIAKAKGALAKARGDAA
jgi:hypothetical protein